MRDNRLFASNFKSFYTSSIKFYYSNGKNLLSWIMHKFWERHLPAVHLDDLHSIDNFIHQPDPLVSFSCSFYSQFCKLLTNPCWKVHWIKTACFFVVTISYFAKVQLLLKGLFQQEHLDQFYSIIIQYKWGVEEELPKGYGERAEMYQICLHHWKEDWPSDQL